MEEKMIMMKIIFLAFVFVLECQAFSFLPESCQSDKDCKETQCCLSVGVLSFPKICQDRPEEGDLCIGENSKINKIIPTCPCRNDMKCVPTEGSFKLSFCAHVNKDDNSTETEMNPGNEAKPENATAATTITTAPEASSTTTTTAAPEAASTTAAAPEAASTTTAAPEAASSTTR